MVIEKIKLRNVADLTVVVSILRFIVVISMKEIYKSEIDVKDFKITTGPHKLIYIYNL